MLGYDHYCGSLAKINDYIKGKYDYPGTKDKVPSIEQKLELWKNEKVEELRRSLISWIDLFFFSDLHIIGLGLDFSETDIWWILNKRKRLIADRKVEEFSNKLNKIYFYMTDGDSKKKLLLEYFGVTVIDYFVKNGNFEEVYQKVINSIQ